MTIKCPIPEVVGGAIVAAACLALVLNDKYRLVDRGLLDMGPIVAFVFYVAYKKLYAGRNRYGAETESGRTASRTLD